MNGVRGPSEWRMIMLNKGMVLALALTPVWADVDVTKLPPAASKKDVTYAADIKPLFE